MTEQCAGNGAHDDGSPDRQGGGRGSIFSGTTKGAHMKSMNLKLAVAAVLMAATAVAFAARPPDKGPPTTEATNNLSVPAIMAGGEGAFSALDCGENVFTTLVPPDKAPVYYAEACADTHDGIVCVDEGYYFVQRDAKWQAPCAVVSTANAIGAWGDNLAGDAKLKVGSPIRVELVLWDSVNFADEAQKGYEVTKLEPAELDRLSAYGHLAVDNAGTLEANPKDLGAIVHDPGAWLTIEQMVDGTAVTPPVVYEPAGGEINATGKIIYGYNLRVSVPGIYRATYMMPNVEIDGCEEVDAVCSGTEAYLEFEVIGGGGGGGGKGGGQGGGKPIKPSK
jgi:hypothetical protein